MDTVFIGQIVFFAGASPLSEEDFLPCDGRTVSRQQYQALYSVIGGRYGREPDQNSFLLPDLRGCFPCGAGQGGSGTPSLNVALGVSAGQRTFNIPEAAIPAHSHSRLAMPESAPAIFHGTTSSITMKATVQTSSEQAAAALYQFPEDKYYLAGGVGSTGLAGNRYVKNEVTGTLLDAKKGTLNGVSAAAVTGSAVAHTFQVSPTLAPLTGGAGGTTDLKSVSAYPPAVVVGFFISWNGDYPVKDDSIS